MKFTVSLFTLLAVASTSAWLSDSENTVSSTKISWQPTIDDAIQLSKSSGKPVFAFIVHQTGATRDWDRTFEHPLLAEAITDHYVAIKTNAADLKSVNSKLELTENASTVRLLDSSANDLLNVRQSRPTTASRSRAGSARCWPQTTWSWRARPKTGSSSRWAASPVRPPRPSPV